MARRRKITAEPAIDRSHIVEDNERAGEKVKVRGLRGSFIIIREALNTETETEWVEVWSPEKQFRAFRPEDIRTLPKRRTRGH